MAFNFGESLDIVSKWTMDTADGKAKLEDMAKQIRQHNKTTRDFELVQKELNNQLGKTPSAMDKIKGSLSSMSSGMVASMSAGNLLAGAVGSLSGKFMEAVENSSKFSSAQMLYAGNIKKAREETAGLVSDLDIMMSKNKLVTLGVNMTDEQYNKLIGSATKLARVMGTDAKNAIEDLSIGLARGSVKILDNLGVTFTAEQAQSEYAISIGKTASALTEEEKKLAFVAMGIKKVTEAAKDVPPPMDTLTNAFKRLGIVLENSVLPMINDVNKNWSEASLAMKGITGEMNVMELQAAKTKKEIIELRRAFLSGEGGDIDIRRKLDEEFKRSGLISTDALKGVDVAGTPYSDRQQKRYLAQLADIKRKKQSKGGARKQAADFEPFLQTGVGIMGDNLGINFETMAENRGQTGLSLNLEMENANVQRSIGLYDDFGKQLDEIAKKKTLVRGVTDEETAAYRKANNALSDFAPVGEIAANGFAQVAGGIWEAAEAARAGEMSFGAAMQNMTKATLMGIAQQATVQAAWNTAMGLGELAGLSFGPAGYFAAAASYAAVAALAGGIGLAIPRASGRTSTSRGSQGGYGGTSPSGSYSSSVARTQAKDNQPISINVYLGDINSPSAALIMQKQLSAAIQRAA